MSLGKSLNTVLKYLTDKKEDFYHAISDPHEMTPHLAYADWLEENGQPELSNRIKHEVGRNQSGVPLTPVRLGEGSSDRDFVLNAIRTRHPNPTVRALATQSGRYQPTPQDLIDLLLHSDPKVRPQDHDVAVTVAPNDPVRTHSAHSHLGRINSLENRDAGLEAKIVRGTVYLLDHEHPDRHAYGAPGIVFEAPANDKNELDAMARHADELRASRSPEGFGPAHMGPVTHTS